MLDKPNAKTIFTAILEFEGTTSAAQVTAESPEVALQKWVRGLESTEAYGLTTQQVAKLLDAFDLQENAVPVRGLVNVWCKTILAEKQLAVLHLIHTMSSDLFA
jgi:hypothetical protein